MNNSQEKNKSSEKNSTTQQTPLRTYSEIMEYMSKRRLSRGPLTKELKMKAAQNKRDNTIEVTFLKQSQRKNNQ